MHRASLEFVVNPAFKLTKLALFQTNTLVLWISHPYSYKKVTLLLKIKYKFLEVYINEHHASGRSVVYFKWYGLLLDQEAMKGMDEITDLVKEVKATDLVTNFDDYKGSSIKISQYMRSTWTDDLYQAGIKRVYRNEAKGAFEQFSLNASITQDDSNPFELISYEAPRDKPDYWLSLPFIEG